MNTLWKYSLFLLLLFTVLIGCSTKVSEKDLIGGTWEATAGYEDGKPTGEPYGSYIITEGFEFKDENTVYVVAYEDDFEYKIEKGSIIVFNNDDYGEYLVYHIDLVGKDEIGIYGTGDLLGGESVYMERQSK